MQCARVKAFTPAGCRGSMPLNMCEQQQPIAEKQSTHLYSVPCSIRARQTNVLEYGNHPHANYSLAPTVEAQHAQGTDVRLPQAQWMRFRGFLNPLGPNAPPPLLLLGPHPPNHRGINMCP